MTRNRLYSILLIALGSILFMFFLQTRKQIEQFEDPTAVNEATEPASLMPSCRITPEVDSV
jgi:hypothetical protein